MLIIVMLRVHTRYIIPATAGTESHADLSSLSTARWSLDDNDDKIVEVGRPPLWPSSSPLSTLHLAAWAVSGSQ